MIYLDALTARDEAAWRDLAVRAVDPNPFFEPDLVLAAHSHLDARHTGLIVAEQPSGWTGCLPVRRTRLGGVIGALSSWCHSYAFLGAPLVDREQPSAAFVDLVATADRQRGSHVIALPLLHTPTFPREALAERGFVIVHESRHERAALERSDAGRELSHLGRHHLKELKRLWRRLEETLGAPLELHDRSEDPRAVDAFLAVEASGWKGREGTALGSTAGHTAFFRDLCNRFRARERLQLLALEAAGRTVAVKCNLAAGEGVFCFKIGYDETLRSFSPGVQLERLNMKVFHDTRTERWMDSCAAADNEMINRLWLGRREISSVVVADRRIGATLSAPVGYAVRLLRRRRPSGARQFRVARTESPR